jgi:pimeloyl-ACP methyl ester carboxylesterase
MNQNNGKKKHAQKIMLAKRLYWAIFLLVWSNLDSFGQERPAPHQLKIATFDVDATPPIGDPLTYDSTANSWDLGLRAKGIVLQGAGLPIVLVAVDWIGIANDSQDAFKEALAHAANTVPERVAVHALHQHDAPISDFGAEKILLEAGLDPAAFESSFDKEVIRRLQAAIRVSLPQAQPVTHIGIGEAAVEKVASNRRILGPDGKAIFSRTSSTKDSTMRAKPEGLIDPMVQLISFWNGDKPLSVLSYYAVHPQSYYLTKVANPDFPGVARFFRQLAVPDALHVHFNGAGANVTAGKYNDGSHENRLILAERMAEGMKNAWESTKKHPVSAEDVGWAVEPVALKPKPDLHQLEEQIAKEGYRFLSNNMIKLSWLKRAEAGKTIDISCLKLGPARVLHMPGELFVEYQLAAKAERPDLFVAMAAYGDYGPFYIGDSVAYHQGGYEAITSPVTAEAEPILMGAIQNLLHEDGISSPPRHKTKTEILEGMEAAMGFLPSRENLPPMNIQVLESQREPSYTRQSILLTVAKGEQLPAYLYLPHQEKPAKKLPAMLVLHGTGDLGKQLVDGKSHLPNRALAKELAERGYVVIAPDYPSMGDLKDYDFDTDRYQSGTMKAIFNHMRSVDLLAERPEVDPERIGVIGHSLGGHNAIFVGAFDSRLKVVVSSCGWTPFRHYNIGEEASQRYGGRLGPWAQDRYMPLIRDKFDLDESKIPFDFPEVIASLAPRAFFTNSPNNDSNFDVQGVHKGMTAITAAYHKEGALDRLQAHFPDANHDFPTETRLAAYEFIDKVLRHQASKSTLENPVP